MLESKLSLESVGSCEAALERGWEVYMGYVEEWKISLNVYMLQEYVRAGGKSFLKKERQILFTGISNLYSELLPVLKGRGKLKLLH